MPEAVPNPIGTETCLRRGFDVLGRKCMALDLVIQENHLEEPVAALEVFVTGR